MLTDNEIIKALEMCAERIICLVPYEDNGTQFYQLSVGYILDLINRLQAENERLKQNNKAIMQTIADVHTEAIKEFAERVYKDCNFADCTSNPAKNEMASVHNEGVNDERKRIKNIVNNLLKELVGEEYGESSNLL